MQREWGAGSGVGAALGGHRSLPPPLPAPSRPPGGATPARGHPPPGGGSSPRREPSLRGRAPHPLPPPGPRGCRQQSLPRHWGRRRGRRRIRRDRAGVSLPGPETPCPIPASYRPARRDPNPHRPLAEATVGRQQYQQYHQQQQQQDRQQRQQPRSPPARGGGWSCDLRGAAFGARGPEPPRRGRAAPRPARP